MVEETVKASSSLPESPVGPKRSRKRPRRSTTRPVGSYVVPGSDDEAISREDEEVVNVGTRRKVEKETNLQLWIKHLGLLAKIEKRNVS